MKKAAVFSAVALAAIIFIAGCSNVVKPGSSSQAFAQNVIPLNYGMKVLGSDTSTKISAFISGAQCFMAIQQLAGGYARTDTFFYKNTSADSGHESITKLDVQHAEYSSIYFMAGEYLPAAEILMIEETAVVQGQHRYLRYVSGYFSNGNFNIVQDTAIVIAMNYGGYYHPYGPYGTSFGEFRSIVLQDGFPNRTVLDGSMAFPHEITVAEEYAAGEISDTGCPASCGHFFRITVCSLGESPNPWVKPRSFSTGIKDSIDLGLCTLLVCKAKTSPIDSAYAELQNGDKTVYFYAREGLKIWELFPLNLP